MGAQHSLAALEALKVFLSLALTRRTERHISFASNEKTRSKFLQSIYHDLEKDLDCARAIPGFGDTILDSPGYLFEPDDTFGEKFACFRDILESNRDSFRKLPLERDMLKLEFSGILKMQGDSHEAIAIY